MEMNTGIIVITHEYVHRQNFSIKCRLHTFCGCEICIVSAERQFLLKSCALSVSACDTWVIKLLITIRLSRTQNMKQGKQTAACVLMRDLMFVAEFQPWSEPTWQHLSLRHQFSLKSVDPFNVLIHSEGQVQGICTCPKEKVENQNGARPWDPLTGEELFGNWGASMKGQRFVSGAKRALVWPYSSWT